MTTTPPPQPVSYDAPPDPTGRAARHAARHPLLTLAVAVAGLAGLLWAALWPFSPSGWVRYEPGPAFTLHTDALDPAVRAAVDEPQTGSLLLLTVYSHPLTHLDRLTAALRGGPDGDEVIDPLPAGWDPTTARPGAALRVESEQTAARVAFERLGEQPPPVLGLQVAAIDPDGIAAGSGLQIGAVIEQVNGRPVQAADDLDQPVRTIGVRDVGQVTLPGRGQATRPLGLEVVEVRPSPFEVELTEVGGSSGGLMLTLLFLDTLTDGDLTAGRTVAGTGRVTSDGTVEPVEGVGAKIAAARDAGAEVMFVPTGSLDVRDHVTAAGQVELVEVRDVTDAIDWLCQIGTTGPLCTRPAGR